MSSRSTVVVFECLHTATFAVSPPHTGEVVYCSRCGDYKTVAQAPHDYRVKCDDCVFDRAVGNAFVTAETLAVKHSTRKAGHRVVLTDGDEEVRVFHHPVIHVEVGGFPF